MVADEREQEDLNNILRDWAFLAAVAWEGHLKLGSGVVVVDVDDSGTVDIVYAGGDPCACHAHLLRDYNPDTHAVVAIRRGGEDRVYVLSGTISPKEAFENGASATVQ